MGRSHAWQGSILEAMRGVGRGTSSGVALLAVTLAVIAAFPSPSLSGTDAPSCVGKPATVVGTTGPDELQGTPERDVFFTGAGRDRIEARGGNDLVCAGADSDRIDGGGGDDTVMSGSERDLVRGGYGGDRVYGRTGKDGLLGDGGPDLLRGGSESDFLGGGDSRDRCLGGAPPDGPHGGDRALPDCERVRGAIVIQTTIP